MAKKLEIKHDPGGEGLPFLADEPDLPAGGVLPDVPLRPPSPAEKAARLARSNRNIKYACTECGREVGRDNLKVKRVQYREMGVGGRIEKSRVVGWLCIIPNGDDPSCLAKDADYAMPMFSVAPGMADTKLAAVAGQ